MRLNTTFISLALWAMVCGHSTAAQIIGQVVGVAFDDNTWAFDCVQ